MALRDIVTKDVGWKLFSVMLALAIWLIVHAISADSGNRINPLNGSMTHTFQSVPVLAVSSVGDMRAFKVSPGAVQVTVSGKPEAINALETKQLHALVDLTELESARDWKKRVDVSAPPGITVISTVPTDVTVVVPPKSAK